MESSAALPTIGAIGAGFHASTNIVPALRLAGIPLAALATRDRARSAAALSQWGWSGTPYGSAADLLADATLDAVILVAQPADQALLTAQALAAGKHVFVDKPLGWNADEARALAQAADAAGRIVMVGFMKRYAPIYRQLKELIDSGDLGALRSFALRFGCDSTPFCSTEEEFLKLAAIHMVDLVRYLFGEAVTVSAVNSGEGAHVALSVTLGFASGVSGTLSLSGLPSLSSETESMTVTGDRGYASTTEATSLSVHVSGDADSPTWQTLTEKTTVFTPAESAMSGVGRDLYLRGFVGEVAAFADAVARVEQPTSSALDNVATMELVDRILASSASHRENSALALDAVSAARDAVAGLERMEFGDPGAFRDEMVARILSGRKTGSSTLKAAYEAAGQPSPVVGEYRALIGSSGAPVAVVEFVEVAQTSLDAVTPALASHESPSVEAWRTAHAAYFETLVEGIREHRGEPSWTLSGETPVIATVFRVVAQLS